MVRRRTNTLLMIAAFFAVPSAASAAEPTATATSTATATATATENGTAFIREQMHAYYASEAETAHLFTGVGAASAFGGGVMVGMAASGPDGELARALGWSLLAVGGLEAVGAAFYAFQVDAERVHYDALLARDPAAFKREEGAHIHGTTSRFVAYRLAELGLAVAGAGVATYGFAKNQDTAKGIGIGVGGEALLFFFLDAFGQARAKEYEEQVGRFEPKVGVQVGGGERPWGMSVGGRF